MCLRTARVVARALEERIRVRDGLLVVRKPIHKGVVGEYRDSTIIRITAVEIGKERTASGGLESDDAANKSMELK